MSPSRKTPKTPTRSERGPSTRIRSATSQSLPEAAHLANVLSHRLRGLVSGITGFTDLLLEQLGRQGQRDLAMRILESAQRIEHVLADLKHFTRPIDPQPETIGARELLAEVARTSPEDIAQRLSFDLDSASDVHVHADRYLARDALGLLVHNAAEAAPGEAPIGLSTTRLGDGSAVAFEVTNPGMLDEETTRQMFEPFFTTKARNLGVGLPLARRIARAQSGDVVLTESGTGGLVILALILPSAVLS